MPVDLLKLYDALKFEEDEENVSVKDSTNQSIQHKTKHKIINQLPNKSVPLPRQRNIKKTKKPTNF